MSALGPAAASASSRAGARLAPLSLASVLLAGALALLAFAMFPFGRALITAFVAVTLVVLSTIDIERRIIPNRIVLPATALVLVAQCLLFPGQASEWVVGAIVTVSVLAVPRVLGRGWMGMGDVKLGLLLGAALGWSALGALALAFVCAFPVALAVLIHRGLAARTAAIPFGPFLSLGALIVLYGPHLASFLAG